LEWPDMVTDRGQKCRKSWGSSRIFLYDPATGVAYPLAIRTPGGSEAFANPAATVLTTPSREPGLLVTLYLFQPGAAPGEAGPLLCFRPFPQRLTLKEH
jgi:hypothetical protein